VLNCNLFSCHISSFKGCDQYTSDKWHHPLKIELIYAESATNLQYLTVVFFSSFSAAQVFGCRVFHQKTRPRTPNRHANPHRPAIARELPPAAAALAATADQRHRDAYDGDVSRPTSRVVAMVAMAATQRRRRFLGD
jgi:hypothetical protein